MTEISIEGLDKAKVLAGLYNGSRPLGMGFLHYDPVPMTEEEAQEILEQATDFDYLKGRVMKVDLSGVSSAPWLYDRDNGEGAAKPIIDALYGAGPDVIEALHADGVREAAKQAMEGIAIKSRGVADQELGGDSRMICKYLGPRFSFRYNLYVWLGHLITVLLDPFLYPFGYCCDLYTRAAWCRLLSDWGEEE